MQKLKVAGLVLVGVLLLVMGYQFLQEHDARLKAEVQVSADQETLKQLKAQDLQHQQEMQQVLEANKALQEKLTAQFQQAKTPQDIAGLVAQLMALQKPVTFVTPPATKENPNPAPVAQVPVEDAPQVKAYVQACETCKLDLSTTKAELTYAQQQNQKDKEALALQTKETETWKQAAKGTFWGNTKKALKWAAIGGGVAIVATCGTGHCK